MKKLLILTTIIFALIFSVSCSTATETAKETPKETTKTTTEKPKEEPKSDSQPDETTKTETKDSDAPKTTIDPDKLDSSKPLSVDEAINAMLSDSKAWEGKEITVKGELNGASTSNMKDGSKVVIQQIANPDGRNVMDCRNTYADGKVPENPAFKGEFVFKGKVKSIDAKYKEFDLEPCEIQK